MMTGLWILVAVLLAALVWVGRMLSQVSVREFLLNRELELYREIVESQESAAFFDSKGDKSRAADHRQIERQARERLERFKPVRDRCEREKVSWEQMVRLLHAEGLYEKPGK